MVSAVFHLNNKEAKGEVKVNFNAKTLLLCSEPNYLADLGAEQDAHVSPTPRVTSQKADDTRRSLEAACWLRLGWWSNNAANSHLSSGPFNRRVLRSCLLPFTNPFTNDNLGTVIPASTPADNLPIFAGIQTAELRRKGATLSPASRAIEPGHLLQSDLAPSPGGNAWHRQSTHPFAPAAQLMRSSEDNSRSASLWGDHRWKSERLVTTTRLTPYFHSRHRHPPS